MIHKARPMRTFLSSNVVLPQRVKSPVDMAKPEATRAALPSVLWILEFQLNLI